QRLRTSPNVVDSLLGGPHRKSRVDLGGAGCFRGGDDRLALGGVVGHRLLALLGAIAALLQLGQLGDRANAVGLQLVTLLSESAAVVLGGAGRLTQSAQVLICRRDRRIGVVEGRQRVCRSVLAGCLFGQRAGQRRRQLTDLRLGSGQFGAGGLNFGGDLQR